MAVRLGADGKRGLTEIMSVRDKAPNDLEDACHRYQQQFAHAVEGHANAIERRLQSRKAQVHEEPLLKAREAPPSPAHRFDLSPGLTLAR